ncbi:MAG: T9SS type A sorting domain-containing protein [Candidatus Kapaibacterium sp.]
MRTRKRSWQGVLTTIVLLLLTTSSNNLWSQSGRGVGWDTGTVNAPPIVRMWNWPDTTFLIGAYGGGDAIFAPSGKAGDIWPFLESLGINLYVSAHYYEPGGVSDSIRAIRHFDTLAWSTDVGKGNRIAQWDAWPFANQIGYARAVEFYPFDSVQSPYYLFKFEKRSGGETDTNATVLINNHRVLEQVYNTTNTTAGTVIAEHISFNEWDDAPSRIYRWGSEAVAHGDDSVQTVDRWIIDDLIVNDGGRPNHLALDSLYYVVVTGHLFENGTSSDSDSLLKIEVIYEVPKNDYFYAGTSPPRAKASTDTTFPVTTLYVTKNGLKPVGPPFNWDRYREAIFPIDLRFLANGAWGPTNLNTLDSAISRRFDLKVTWLGGEQLALRSVSLRSLHGQLTLGTDAAAKAWRQQRINLIRRLLYGSSSYNVSPDSLRRAYIGIHPAEEQHPTAYAGLEYLTQMVRDTFNVPRPGGASGERDSVGEFTAQSYIATLFHHHHLSTPSTTVIENYLWMQPSQGDDSVNKKKWFNLTFEEIPNIREENGGRFYLGEIDIDNPASVEEYEKTLQHLHVGRYIPDWSILGPRHPDSSSHPGYRKRWGLLHRLGDAARISRATGRRLIQVPSNNGSLELKRFEENGVWKLDTLVGHMPTEAELKMVVNLGLAYGSKGAVYWWLPSTPDIAHNYSPDSTVWATHGVHAGLGPIGSDYKACYTGDTVDNTVNWTLHSGHHIPKADPVDTIPNFYVGFGTRTRAVRHVNHRLQKIGRAMMDLTWRESYSIHYTVPRPGSGTNGMLDFKSRPINSNEIIQEVIATHPITGVRDSAYATFVEIGLFDKKTGTTNGVYDPLKDTLFTFIVNRRTFERPDHISETSARGMKMDSLAETRLLKIRWNIPHPDTTQYPFIRIREVLPPTDSIPLIGLRHTLDTVIAGRDSSCYLVLGAGQGTLLEITFPTPDTSLIAGDLRWPGQRKLAYDGYRYFATYSKDRIEQNGDTNSIVVLRLSYPIADTTGSILWIPQEFVLSDAYYPNDTVRTDNRFPSLTLSRQPYKTTYLTITWSCHPPQLNAVGDREIVVRNYKLVDYSGVVNPPPGTPPLPPYTWSFSPVRHVSWYDGPDAELWGTPVVGYTHGAAVIAWSDSSAGIISRLLPRNFNNWVDTLFYNLAFSPPDSLTLADKQTFAFSAQYPSLPPWTPITRTDSTIGITWRQPRLTRDDIRYNRLLHTPADAIVRPNPPSLSIATWNAKRWYPSIDIIQDTATGIHREGITWEDDFQSMKVIYFQSLLTPSSGITGLSNRAAYVVLTNGGGTTWPDGEIYPQTSVLGAHDTSSSGSVQFGIGYQVPKTSPDLWQALVNWDSTTFRSDWPQQYSLGGEHPNVAANIDQTWRRFAILYQSSDFGGTGSRLRTSRQFFAKHTRPVGYAAEGRDVRFRIDDSTGTGFHVLLFDPWYADANRAAGLPMVVRGNGLQAVDSIPQLAQLFRTQPFQASDSVTLGCRLYASFHGDSSIAAGDRVDLIVEIIDSASGDVVAELDSMTVSAEESESAVELERTLDLLSGTYYLRLRFASASFPSDAVPYDCLYPVAEFAGWIPTPVSAKSVRRIDGEAGNGLRISAQPNPTTGETEFRFSVSRKEHVSLTVYDAMGREVDQLLQSELFSPGRYAVEFDGSKLKPGTYIVELETLNGRVTEKIVVKR